MMHERIDVEAARTITRAQIAAVLGERGSPLARSHPYVNRRIRQLRAIAKARGEISLPAWRWTASQDKALIDHIRANPHFHAGFWDEAGKASRGCKGHSALWRWHALRGKGVPLPAIIYPPRPCQRKWPAETVAEILADVQTAKYCDVARRYGVSLPTINGIVQRYRDRRRRSCAPVRRRAAYSAQELADIALMERVWAEHDRATATGVKR